MQMAIGRIKDIGIRKILRWGTQRWPAIRISLVRANFYGSEFDELLGRDYEGGIMIGVLEIDSPISQYCQ